MHPLLLTTISTFLISLVAFVGVISLIAKKRFLDKIVVLLVALSAGALMGGAFLHLLPESLETLKENAFIFVLAGFILFFIVEKYLWWRHEHKIEKHSIHTFAYMNLFGDSIHNFIDGLIIASSFFVSTELGIATSIAILFHEIPQELGDFGVLIYGGFSVAKALLLNFAVATTAIAGGIIGYFISNITTKFTMLFPIAAGGFIYIAASDLIPELRHETYTKKSLLTLLVFIAGIALMYLVKVIHS